MRKGKPISPTNLYWGQQCRHVKEHANAENHSLRIRGVGCVLCLEKYAGMTAQEIEQKINDDFNNWSPPTPESVRQKQIEHSRNWTLRNKEKHLGYQRKYFQNLSEEKKEERKQKQRDEYAKNREKILARNKAWYEKQKALKQAAKDQDGHKGT